MRHTNDGDDDGTANIVTTWRRRRRRAMSDCGDGYLDGDFRMVKVSLVMTLMLMVMVSVVRMVRVKLRPTRV